MKIAFIGGGNMATALIGGMLKQGFAAADLSAVEPFETARAKLAAQFGVACTAAPSAALGEVDVILLAVKPQNMRDAAQAVAPYLNAQLIVSIAAGTRIVDLSRWLGSTAATSPTPYPPHSPYSPYSPYTPYTPYTPYESIVRCMPNTPALIGMGITGLYAAPAVSAAQRVSAERILRAVGDVVWVENEALIDPVTAVSGSGPAYVFYFLEAMAEAGVKLGLPAEDVKRLALATFSGAAKLAAESPDDFATLRAKVTSKGGTTEAALKVMMERQVKEAIGSALAAASARGKELGEMLGRD